MLCSGFVWKMETHSDWCSQENSSAWITETEKKLVRVPWCRRKIQCWTWSKKMSFENHLHKSGSVGGQLFGTCCHKGNFQRTPLRWVLPTPADLETNSQITENTNKKSTVRSNGGKSEGGVENAFIGIFSAKKDQRHSAKTNLELPKLRVYPLKPESSRVLQTPVLFIIKCAEWRIFLLHYYRL